MDEFKVENVDLIKDVDTDNDISKRKMQFKFNANQVNPKICDQMEVDSYFGIQLAPQQGQTFHGCCSSTVYSKL
jgi:hypothetical protein